jgi:outer membrane protein OmpA-like peptidoglycan-associated protein
MSVERGLMRYKSILLPLLVLITISSVSILQAMPSWYGVRGLYRVLDARVPSQGSYSTYLATSYEFSRVWDLFQFNQPDYPDVDTTILVRDTEHYADATFMIGYGIREDLEAAVTFTYRLNAYQYEQVDPRSNFVGYFDASWGLGDLRATLKYSHQLMDWLHIGGAGWFSYPLSKTWADTVTDYDGVWNEGDVRLQVRRPFLSTGQPAFGVMALATADYPPVVGHLNLGFSYYSQEYVDCNFPMTSQSDPAIDLGVGVEAPTNFGVPFVEFTMKYFVSRSGSKGYGFPARICGGFRVTEESGSYIDLIGIVGLTKYDRYDGDPYVTGELPVPEGIPGSWGVMIAMGFDKELVTGGAGAGTIAGTILDSRTGQPVQATITFVDTDYPPVSNDPSTGFFSVRVPSGLYVARIEAEGFTPGSVTISVERGSATPADVLLSPAGGTLTGTVRDRETGAPVPAIISADGLDAAVSASSEGEFSLELPAGTWTVKAQAEGYLTSSETVAISAGAASSVNFSMSHALVSGQVLTFANIYFDSGSSNIKSSSYGVLDGIVSLLIDNSEVRVEVVGHTDSDGSDSSNQRLSEQRAQSVVNFLTQRGVPASMLSTSGQGESNPVASNSTSEGKAQNRRIEFRVL